MKEYKYGLVSISFRGEDPETIAAAAKRAGLECIEWGSDIHAPANDETKLQNIVKLQEEYGLYCSSYGTYFTLGSSDIRELQGYINAAHILGCDILRLFCGNRSADKYTREEKKKFFDECKRAAEIAGKNGVKLCMECHNNSYTQTLDGALELMDAVSSADFRMYWQKNPYLSENENFAYASAVAPYCEHIHVFEWNGDARFPLAGAVQAWRKYLGAFGTGKTLLLEFMPDDSIKSLDGEARALFAITGRQEANE